MEHYWTVKGWMTQDGMGRNAFSIWASPEFINDALAMLNEYGVERLKESANHIIQNAASNYGDQSLAWGHHLDHAFVLAFNDEVGLCGIDVPGNACCIGLEYPHHDDHAVDGYTLSPHNIDSPMQQSALMAIWVMYAHAVEACAAK